MTPIGVARAGFGCALSHCAQHIAVPGVLDCFLPKGMCAWVVPPYSLRSVGRERRFCSGGLACFGVELLAWPGSSAGACYSGTRCL